MALADYDAYVAALRRNLVADFQTAGTVGRTQRLSAAWRNMLPVPLVPTISVATFSINDVSIGPIPSVGAGRLTLLGGRFNTAGVSGVGMILVDVLNHSGGLVGNVATVQTTGLPTAALPRYTSGEGVMAGLIVYTAIGATATTVTINYTNQAGTSGRVSTATLIGSSVTSPAGSFLPIPLANGDTGVRSVQSVTLLATTGTAGNMGVVLYRPLQMIALNDVQGAMPLDAVSSGGIVGALCEILPNACLSVLCVPTVVQTFMGALLLAEV